MHLLSFGALLFSQFVLGNSDINLRLMLPDSKESSIARNHQTPFFSEYLAKARFNKGQIINLRVNELNASLKVTDDSRPEQGFYRLESVPTANSNNRHAGYIWWNEHSIVSMFTLPGVPEFEVLESRGSMRIRLMPSLHAGQKKPDVITPSLTEKASVKAEPFYKKHRDFIVNDHVSEQTQTRPGRDKIDVLVLFDPALETFLLDKNNISTYDIQNRTALVNALANSTLTRSGIPYQHRIAALIPYVIDQDTPILSLTNGKILNLLSFDKRIQALKDRYRADTVHYIEPGLNSFCGQAFFGNYISQSNVLVSTNIDLHSAVTRLDCMGNGTYVHELGHNLGFQHDRKTLVDIDKQNPIDFHIPYGFVDNEEKFYTTMSYASSCQGHCTRENIFSNPNVQNNNSKPMGVDASQAQAANNSKVGLMTVPQVAMLDSFHKAFPLTQRITAQGDLTLSWDNIAGATDYRILGNDCLHDSGIIQSSILNAEPITSTSITVSKDSDLINGLCVYARFESPQGYTSVELVGKASVFVKPEANKLNYVYASKNILDVFNRNDEQSLLLHVSDEATQNSSVKLAIVPSDGGISDLNAGIAEFAKFFSYEVVGSGKSRTLTIRLKKSIDAIQDSLDKSDQRHFHELSIRIVNTDFEHYDVHSLIWLDPQGTYPPRPAVYYSNKSVLNDLSAVNTQFALMHLNNSHNIQIEQIGDTKLDDFSFSKTEHNGEFGVYTRIALNGKTPHVDEPTPLVLRVTSNHPEFAEKTLKFNIVPVSHPPVIESVQGTHVIEGKTPELLVKLRDPDSNIDWGSALLKIDISQSKNKKGNVYKPTSIDTAKSTLLFSLPAVSKGEYPFVIDILDTDGSDAAFNGVLKVLENQKPSVSATAAPSQPNTKMDITLSAQASDSDGSIAKYNWTQASGAKVTISEPSKAKVNLGKLAAGSYEFKVTVEDDLGATSSATVSFNVTTPPSKQGGGAISFPVLILLCVAIWVCRLYFD